MGNLVFCCFRIILHKIALHLHKALFCLSIFSKISTFGTNIVVDRQRRNKCYVFSRICLPIASCCTGPWRAPPPPPRAGPKPSLYPLNLFNLDLTHQTFKPDIVTIGKAGGWHSTEMPSCYRPRSGEGNVFTHVCLSTGVGCGVVWGWGVEGVCPDRDVCLGGVHPPPPPPRWPLPRSVSILLECILVYIVITQNVYVRYCLLQ